MSAPKVLFSSARWAAHRFRTSVRYQADPFGRPECWRVERPDWWRRGVLSGVTDVSPELARTRLDEWQDEMFARSRSFKEGAA